MNDGQWTLVFPGTELTFGTGETPVFNRTTPVVSAVDIRTADTDRPRADGVAFGADFRGAQTISFDLGIRGETEADVRAEVARLALAWRAQGVSSTPGGYAELHTQYAGRSRVAYGRPRRFAVDLSDAKVNHYATAQADFVCMDDHFYAGSEDSQTVTLVPPLGGGLRAPLRAPLTTTATSNRSLVIEVEGDEPAWPVLTLHGPITNPVVDIVGVARIELRTTLAYDDVVTIDTRPWARTALRNGTGNLSGALRGTRLSRASIPPGRHEVALRGIDSTGTAAVQVAWRKTYPSL